LDYRLCPALYADLLTRDTPSTTSLALAFLMLCGSRTNEVLGARCRELDLDERLWVIPGARMKGRKPHVVPLPAEALRLIELARARQPGSEYLFPSSRRGGRLSERRLDALVRDKLKVDTSVHGLRSSLRDYLGNETDTPRETCEEILSHTLSGVEGAYRRQSSTTKKRAALELWAAYLTQGSS
jgi:integrase